MSHPPLIGITGRRKTMADIIGFPAALGHVGVDAYPSVYALGLLEAGALPVYLPIEVDPSTVVTRLDGLLLSGGADIAPERYGHEPETDEFPPEPQRDQFELDLVDAAFGAELPILGICRGLQLLNVHGGGTLHQDVPPHGRFDVRPETEAHTVSFEPSSTLGRLYGSELMVNSLHHQTVDEVGADYRVTARSDDGVVEGLEHRSLPAVSVQWHPEMMTTRPQDPVFSWIVERATERAASRYRA